MQSLSDLRAATVGAQKKFPSRVVVLVADPDLGPRGALLDFEVETDDDGKPRKDEHGAPVLKRDEFGLPVPRLDAGGAPVVLDADADLPRFAVEVRVPSVAVREDILAVARVKRPGAKEAELDTAKLHVEACIRLAFNPGTNDRVWTSADRDALTAQPAGGFVSAVGRVAQALIFPEVAAVGKAARRALATADSRGSSTESAA